MYQYQRKTSRPSQGMLLQTILDIAATKGRVDRRDVKGWSRKGVTDAFRKLVERGRLCVVRRAQIGRYARPGVYALPSNPYGNLVKKPTLPTTAICPVCKDTVPLWGAEIAPHWIRSFRRLDSETESDTERRVSRIMADPRESRGERCRGSLTSV